MWNEERPETRASSLIMIMGRIVSKKGFSGVGRGWVVSRFHAERLIRNLGFPSKVAQTEDILSTYYE